ncbi:regucalcin-like [Belonocnema kinseyi]|uniref:regucalcin-like n=1 Tax=Belonocnema kinseyi TaxID=2817044 RepID=UPI00143D3F5C|nr:regucalcin-like [Belonocnema kinseyi]
MEEKCQFTASLVYTVCKEFISTVFDLPSWALHEGRRVCKGPVFLGRITIDTRGFLWVPLLGGSHVIEINPYSREVGRLVEIPAAKVSACTFGGSSMHILYVSTMGYGSYLAAPRGDRGGTIFAVTNLGNNVKGVQTTPVNL